jgi:hypothetical protein
MAETRMTRPSEEQLERLSEAELFEVALDTLLRIEASALEQSRMLRDSNAQIQARLSEIRSTNDRIERRLGIGKAAADAAE